VSGIETLRVIHLNEHRAVLEIGQYWGTATSVVIPFRRIVADALRLNSSTLVLSHNHPSGDPTPSRADVSVTKQLAALLHILDIRLHDHLIIGDGRSASFRKLGLL
jgi:DNA repair protein RadC